MRIDRVLVELARLEALYPFEARLEPFGDVVEGLSGDLIVELFDGGEPLPATVAADPVAFGCIIGNDNAAAPTLRALKFDRDLFGHGRTPADTSIRREQSDSGQLGL